MEKLTVSRKSSSLAFDEVKEESHDPLDCGVNLEPTLNLLVKSTFRNSILATHATENEVVVPVGGRITVSF